MENIYLTGINLDQLLDKIGQLIDTKLEKVPPIDKTFNQSKFISRTEVAELLKISLPTLNEWSKLGWLQSYKIGNRVLYKLPEVEQALNKVTNLKYRKGGNHAA